MDNLVILADAYINQVVAFIVYIGSFAAIPFIAKRFSGALGQITNMVNDRSKGIFDRARNGLRSAEGNRKKRIKGDRRERAMDRRQRLAEGDSVFGGKLGEKMIGLSDKAGEAVERVKGGGPLIGVSSVPLPGGRRLTMQNRRRTLEHSKHIRESADEKLRQENKEKYMAHLEFGNRQLQWPEFSEKLAQMASDSTNNSGVERQAAMALLAKRNEDDLLRQVATTINANPADKIGIGAWRRSGDDLWNAFGKTKIAPDLGTSGIDKDGKIEINYGKLAEFGDTEKGNYRIGAWRGLQMHDSVAFERSAFNTMSTDRLRNNTGPEIQAWLTSQISDSLKASLTATDWSGAINQGNLDKAIEDSAKGKVVSVHREVVSNMGRAAVNIYNDPNVQAPEIKSFIGNNANLINQINANFNPGLNATIQPPVAPNTPPPAGP